MKHIAATLLLVIASACSSDDGFLGLYRFDGRDVVFLSQTVVPTAVMEALYQGRISVDRNGCMRLDSSESITVIWPKGFRLESRVGSLLVRDATGRVIGVVGNGFMLGGGVVPTLEGMAVSPDDRQRAESRCPGNYWIVGDVP